MLQLLPDHFQTLHVSCWWWEEECYWFWVTRSKVKVNFGILHVKPCGHDTGYSFCLINFQTSHLIFWWWEEKTYWFGVTGSKGQGQLWHSACETLLAWFRLQFLPDHFQTLHVSCWWWEEEPYWFWVTRSKVNCNFGILHVEPCWHDTGQSFCPIAFKLHMQVGDDERRNHIDFGSQGQGQLRHSACETLFAWYRLQFLPDRFQTSHASCWWWEKEYYWFWVSRSKVKVNFGFLHVKPCWHDTSYSFCPMAFKLLLI